MRASTFGGMFRSAAVNRKSRQLSLSSVLNAIPIPMPIPIPMKLVQMLLERRPVEGEGVFHYVYPGVVKAGLMRIFRPFAIFLCDAWV